MSETKYGAVVSFFPRGVYMINTHEKIHRERAAYSGWWLSAQHKIYVQRLCKVQFSE